jgi:transcriptional regulator with XRE-family HTH domain
VSKKSEEVDEKTKRDEFLVEIGERVRRLRDAIGMTQRELGDAAGGISAAYIYMVENGRQNLSLAVFKRIAVGLGVPAEELLGAAEPGAAPTERSVTQLLRSVERLSDVMIARREQDAELVKEMERLWRAYEKLNEHFGEKSTKGNKGSSH